jgi:uncharacterized protein
LNFAIIQGYAMLGNQHNNHNILSSAKRNTSLVFAVIAISGIMSITFMSFKQARNNIRLVRAIENGDLISATGALDHGADPNLEYRDSTEPGNVLQRFEQWLTGRTLQQHSHKRAPRSALCIAMGSKRGIDRQQLDIIRLLLQRGADINSRNNDGETPLMYANLALMPPNDVTSKQAQYELTMLQILLLAGADVNAKDKGGVTALMFAASKGCTDIMDILLRHGAKINDSCFYGGSALSLAAREEHLDAVRFLLNHGADVNVADGTGKTALMVAPSPSNLKIINLLLERGALVDLQNKKGQTVLMEVAEGGDFDAVKLLLKHHANTTLRNAQGKTAADLAVQDEQFDVAHLLKHLAPLIKR